MIAVDIPVGAPWCERPRRQYAFGVTLSLEWALCIATLSVQKSEAHWDCDGMNSPYQRQKGLASRWAKETHATRQRSKCRIRQASCN